MKGIGIGLLATALQIGIAADAGATAYQAVVLHPAGFFDSAGLGISAGGQVGWGTEDVGLSIHALTWDDTAASVTDLHPPAGYDFSVATAGDGSRQVGRGGAGLAAHALLWNGTAGSVVDMHPAGFDWTEATGVSGNFQVGWGEGTATGDFDHALLWNGTAASVVDLNPSGFFTSRAHGIVGNQQIGWAASFLQGGVDGSHAILWNGSASNYVDLHPPSGYQLSYGYGISADSQVGVARVAGPGGVFHAMLWHGTAASAADLHPAGFQESQALGVAGDMQVGYGLTDLPAPGERALLWKGTAASVVDLQLILSASHPTLVDSRAFGITSSGAIIGAAHDNSGRIYAVMWTPVPEPSTAALLCGGLVTLFQPRRRRSK